MLKKPHWTLGLELAPHHFQFQDQYHEELIAQLFQGLFDDSWGVYEIEWDLRALAAAGEVRLERLGAILPDGTPVACGTKESPQTPVRAVPDFKDSLGVYVGIPLAETRGANVDREGDPKAAHRYSADTSMVPDFASGTEPVKVEWLRPNVWLLFDGERLDRFSTLPCARIVRTSEGELAFDESFVPAALSLRASRYLEDNLRTLLEALVARQTALERAAARQALQSARVHLLSLVSAGVADIADLIDQTHVHPRTAYRVLAPLLGGLAVFTPTGRIEIPKFNYLRLGVTFGELFERLGEVLAVLGAEQHRLVPLGRHDAHTSYAELNEPTIFRNEFFLCVSGTDSDRLRAIVPQQVKLAAWNELAGVHQSATAGVPLHPQARPPATLPEVRGTVYFRLDKTAPMFMSVMKTGQLGIFCPPGLGVTELALYVVNPSAL